MTIEQLIAKACGNGSQAALAREIGVHPSVITQAKTGKACPPWVVVRMAEIARVDPVRAVVEYLESSASGEDEIATWKRLLRTL